MISALPGRHLFWRLSVWAFASGLSFVVLACGDGQGPVPVAVATPDLRLAGRVAMPKPSPTATAIRAASSQIASSSRATPTATATREPRATATATPEPTATATATPEPTAAATPSLPLSSSTPIPTLSPTPVRAATGNLAPHTPDRWDGPVVAADRAGLVINTDLTESGEVFIRWAIANNSPNAIDYPFYVDLRFDGVTVVRWPSSGILANQVLMIADWDGLGARVGPQSGTHKLTLVVDSTGLIPETDESDNEFEMEVTWSSDEATAAERPVLKRLPDLVPRAAEGWGSPIVATSYSGDTVDGPLSVDLPSYVRFGVRNDGLTSITEDVWVHLYLDNLLVDMRTWHGLLAGVTGAAREWAGLLDVANVSPGPHTLRVVVDPHNLIAESDETNNDSLVTRPV